MGARAFIPLTLAGALILSFAPAASVAAEEPNDPVLIDPVTPVIDPATDPTPAIDPVVPDPVDPVVDPTPSPFRSSPIRARPPRPSWPRS